MDLVAWTILKRDKKIWFFLPHSIKAVRVAHSSLGSPLVRHHHPRSKIERHPPCVRENCMAPT